MAGRVSTLKWVLECLFDLPAAFEARRHELAVVSDSSEDCSDQEVVESYVDAVRPSSKNPWMLEYLESTQPVIMLGSTVFATGAAPSRCFGLVPGLGRRHSSVSEWVVSLSRFVQTELESFRSRPEYLGGNFKRMRGGEALIDYSSPGGFGGRSILDPGTNSGTSEEIRAFFRDEGIHLITSSVQSRLDAPLVLQRGKGAGSGRRGGTHMAGQKAPATARCVTSLIAARIIQ